MARKKEQCSHLQAEKKLLEHQLKTSQQKSSYLEQWPRICELQSELDQITEERASFLNVLQTKQDKVKELETQVKVVKQHLENERKRTDATQVQLMEAQDKLRELYQQQLAKEQELTAFKKELRFSMDIGWQHILLDKAFQHEQKERLTGLTHEASDSPLTSINPLESKGT